ncbi:MAG: YqjK-like family protein [Zoogloeaceae bacterium]|jgi:hypothetical protein|nr:YqjK-like family protein [Zoogloeaceae bacterium]
MTSRLLELREERGLLRARCAEQRRALAQHAFVLERACALADRAKAGGDWIKRHPALVGGAATFLVLARPARLRRVWRLARWVHGLWRGWRGIVHLRDKLPF